MQAINDNGSKIKSIYATNASIGVQNQPGWANCRLLYERPSKFRLVGTTGLLGRVVDCGCDGEKFWYWNSMQDSDSLYSCKIEEYSQTPLAEVIPVDPTWFPEALGIVEIKEEDLADEPKKQSDGSILLTVNCKRQEGVYKKRIYVESGTAAITRQDVQNPQGETFISVLVTEPQLIESAGVVMPKKASIRCLRTGDWERPSSTILRRSNRQSSNSRPISTPNTSIWAKKSRTPRKPKKNRRRLKRKPPPTLPRRTTRRCVPKN